MAKEKCVVCQVHAVVVHDGCLLEKDAQLVCVGDGHHAVIQGQGVVYHVEESAGILLRAETRLLQVV